MSNTSDFRGFVVNDGEREAPKSEREGKENEGWQPSPLLGPITTAQFLTTKICEYYRQKRTGPKNSNNAVTFWSAALAFLAVLAAVAIAGGIAKYLGYLESPDHVVALFTFVLAIEAGIQFWFMSHQISQTNAIIEKMRLEQRAWLCIEQVQFRQLRDDHKVICRITINNVGHTPGMIFTGTCHQYVTQPDFDEDEIINEFEALGFDTREDYLVIPGRPINLTAWHFPKLPHGQSELIRLGKMQYHVLCRYKYIEVSGTETEIKGFYTYVPEKVAEPDWFGVNTRRNYCCFP